MIFLLKFGCIQELGLDIWWRSVLLAQNANRTVN